MDNYKTQKNLAKIRELCRDFQSCENIPESGGPDPGGQVEQSISPRQRRSSSSRGERCDGPVDLLLQRLPSNEDIVQKLNELDLNGLRSRSVTPDMDKVFTKITCDVIKNTMAYVKSFMSSRFRTSMLRDVFGKRGLSFLHVGDCFANTGPRPSFVNCKHAAPFPETRHLSGRPRLGCGCMRGLGPDGGGA